jgi:NAD(P)-dependent dehydrogenase (short-subunit alcohol dehydrogenase family)
MPFEEFERQIRVSALGPARLTQLLIPIMRKRPRADIVMISSVATKYFPQLTVPYQMGKAAMEALAYTVAREERRNGIRVNVVRPGLIATDAGKILTTMLGASDIEELDHKSPFGRLGRPEDVAGAVRLLVSDNASFISGQCIDVDGAGGMETRINAWTDQGAFDFAEEFGRLRDMKRSR